jgi:hypothetical protein
MNCPSADWTFVALAVVILAFYGVVIWQVIKYAREH